MIARIVAKKDEALLALLLTGVAALGLALLVADDVWHVPGFPAPRAAVYTVVALLIVLGGVGPWLAWPRRRGRSAVLRCDEGRVRIGASTLTAADVRGVSLVPATQGHSVAIAHGAEVTFLELEREEDAARLTASLGAPEAPSGGVAMTPRTHVLALPQLALSVLAVLCATGYFFVTTQGAVVTPAGLDPKAFFGLGGVIAVELSMVLLLVRRVLPEHGLGPFRSGAWDSHVALHARRQRAPVSSVAPAPLPRLARGDEPVGRWLARIDALPAEPHAYRGDAMNKRVLWETLGDGGAPVDARMAAARVLRRRHGEHEAALVRVVDDAEVRVRVEAVMGEQEEAERDIETLGPLFRAR